MEPPAFLREMLERMGAEENPEGEAVARAMKLLNEIARGDKGCCQAGRHGRQWNERIDHALRQMWLTPTIISNPCAYSHIDAEMRLSLVFLYVDDFFIASKNENIIQ